MGLTSFTFTPVLHPHSHTSIVTPWAEHACLMLVTLLKDLYTLSLLTFFEEKQQYKTQERIYEFYCLCGAAPC